MNKWVYISADYDEDSGDQEVIKELNKWSNDRRFKVTLTDTAQVASGSVSKDPDCRACDLKDEFNRQINASSSVIIIIGDMTRFRTAGDICPRAAQGQSSTECTPYKGGIRKPCKISVRPSSDGNDISKVNTYSYIQHEFEQAKKRGKNIVVVYNSLNNMSSWLPPYMNDYEDAAHPFWKKNDDGEKVGDYEFIKKALGFND
ncbi:MAG: hypothetical protein HDT16_08555 [Oscillibacter sp.]|nr:hypothetical protein [Oscillibacter sp.]